MTDNGLERQELGQTPRLELRFQQNSVIGGTLG